MISGNNETLNKVGGKRNKASASFWSRGKLLITGEYAVLYGAGSLALPVKQGQKLIWSEGNKGPGRNSDGERDLKWVTRVNGKKWFSAVFRGSDYLPVSADDWTKADFLRHIIFNASRLSDGPPLFGKVESLVDFDMEWGLGSSSSLISNVAFMFDVNPFALHFAVSKGSGYDIACARSNSPVIYRLSYQSDNYSREKTAAVSEGIFPVPVYRAVDFNPPFKDKLFFAYTGRKQDSAVSVNKFLSGTGLNDNDVAAITRIGEEVLKVGDIGGFNSLLKEHDHILSGVLDEVPVNESLFGDFPGYVKSLGAWGGDFVLISWEGDVKDLEARLKQKGIDIVLPYDTLIFFSNGK